MSINRVAMISGANRGIGLAIAQRLAASGYTLSLGLRRPDAAPRHLLDAAAGRVSVHRYDAAERDAGETWVAATLAAHGRIDIVVNNAGIAPLVSLEGGSDEALDLLMDVNVKAPFRVLRAALPYLKASGSGRVINIASLSGKRVMGGNTGYQMSKHAVVALTHAARRLGWDAGVRATAICPSYVNTDLVAGATDVAAADMTQPEDLARLIQTIIELPNTASVAELVVNCRNEASV